MGKGGDRKIETERKKGLHKAAFHHINDSFCMLASRPARPATAAATTATLGRSDFAGPHVN